MSKKVSLLICFVLVLCLGSMAVAEDLNPPGWSRGPNTCEVFWEFDDGTGTEANDAPTSYLYTPEPNGLAPDPCFGFRVYGNSWDGGPDPANQFLWDPSGIVFVEGEESTMQPIPDGNGANLTVYVQVTWQGGGFSLIQCGIECWGGYPPFEEGEIREGEWLEGVFNEETEDEGDVPVIAESVLDGGWKHTTLSYTFEEFPVETTHVGFLFFGWAHEGITVDEVVVDMIIHDGNVPEGGGQVRVSNESPEHEADHVNPNTNLSFQAPAQALCIDPNSDPNLAGPFEYDVWFGLEPNAATMIQLADDYSPTNCNDVMVFDPCSGGDLAVATVYYWKVDITDLNSPGTPQFYPQDDPNGRGVKYFSFRTWGLADVLNPANGATEVAPPVLLEWGPDGYASSCDIYFGTSFAEVNSVDSTDTTGIYIGEQPVSDANYDAGMLDLSKSYYWRIDEKNGTAIKGDVWSFTTGDYFALEDFESYASNTQLYAVWDDYWVNSSGSAIFLVTDVNFVLDEEGKSLLYQYDSAWKNGPTCVGSVADADIADMLVGSDWTISGIRSILIHFMGTAGNSATANDQMWLELEDASSNSGLALYDGDMNNLAVEEWQEWNIDLAIYDACGVDLTNVDKIHLGFGGPAVGDCKAGGTGQVYFDEIELHPRRCRPEVIPWDIAEEDCKTDGYDIQLMAEDWMDKDYQVFPTPPDRNNLLVEYLFTGTDDYSDTSGNGLDGQPSPTLTHVANGYLTIENAGGHVDIPFEASNPFHGPTDYSVVIEYGSEVDTDPTVLMTSTDPCLPTSWEEPNVDQTFALYSPMGLIVGESHEGGPSAPDEIAFTHDNWYKALAEVYKLEVGGIGSWHTVAVTYDADGGICPDEPWDPNACPPGTVTGLVTVYIDSVKGDEPLAIDPNIPVDANYDIVRIGDAYNPLHADDWGFISHIGDINEVLIYDVALTEGEVYYASGITDPTYVPNSSAANVVPKSPPGGPYDPNNPDIVNFLDYERLADNWLTGPWLWPDP
ncbi:MAG: hypothetical protein JSW23_00395 [Planctomycetota bacterium]|nr:MAG: hypothetical protein JSW23_00395 [Planctomycetota bacterium]